MKLIILLRLTAVAFAGLTYMVNVPRNVTGNTPTTGNTIAALLFPEQLPETAPSTNCGGSEGDISLPWTKTVKESPASSNIKDR